MKTIAYTDGATWETNPGLAGIGVILEDEDGNQLVDLCRPLGHMTNNEAEYRAVLAAIELWLFEVNDDGSMDLEIRSDSQLVVNQVNGEFATNSDGLRPYQQMVRGFIDIAAEVGGQISLVYIPREQNKKADALSKAAASLSNDLIGERDDE